MNRKIRWAIIGIGKVSPRRGGANAIAYAHAEALKRNSDKFELVAGASRNQQNLDDFKREYPCNTYQDINELLQKERPEGVTISTYAPSREEHVIAAIRAGAKFILVEKPLALSFRAMQNMQSEAEKYGARLFVSFQRRYGQPFVWARETVLSGAIGRVFQVDLHQPFSNFWISVRILSIVRCIFWMILSRFRSLLSLMKRENSRGTECLWKSAWRQLFSSKMICVSI